jgi:adenylate cyclase
MRLTTSLLPRTHQIKRLARGLLMGAIAALSGALALTTVGTTFERNFGLNWLFTVRGAISPPPEVVVVAINDTTGRALDLPKLPRDWPRTVHADLIRRLVERDAAVIVFDMDFSRAKSAYEDSIFGKAISEADRIVLFEWLAGRRERLVTADGNTGGWTWVEEKQSPTPALALSAKAMGPFPLPKVDQAAYEFWSFKTSVGDAPTTAAVALQLYALDIYDRWRAVLVEADAPGVADLPMRTADLRRADQVRQLMKTLRRAFTEDPGLLLRVHKVLEQDGAGTPNARERRLIAALASLYAGSDHQYLDFYGPAGTIRTVPYQALLADYAEAGASNVGDLAGRVVFVGYSDLYNPDQPDRFYTVFTNKDGIDLSGVEIMATAFANLLNEQSVLPSDTAVTAFCVLWFGFTIGAALYLLPALIAVPSAFALSGIYAAYVQWKFNESGLWLPLATPALVQLPVALLVGLMGQYLLERRKERRIARAISYYLPENIVKDLTEKQIDPASVNKIVFGTCLATDMTGFTRLSESMPPKELATFMNSYFGVLADVLKRHGVDVTEFHADTIMCAWTGAEQSPTMRRKAALGAIEVSETIERFAREHGSMRIYPRIGLQDGYFYLGHTGGGGHFVYSVLGDTANTASRLESLNRHLGTHILAAESVVQAADGILLARPLGSFRLMGKSDPTSVVEILGLRNGAAADKFDRCALFANALAAFRTQQWAVAAGQFESILERFPDDGPSRFYLSRCRDYAAVPPTHDDPTVMQMTDK